MLRRPSFIISVSWLGSVGACSDSASRSGAPGSASPSENRGATSGPGVVPPAEAPATNPDGVSSEAPPAAGLGEAGTGDISLDTPSTDPTAEVPAVPEVAPEPPVIWPNAESYTNSDPWLAENHDRITRLEPRVLVINFDASEMVEVARTFAEQVAGAFAEGSRYHGNPARGVDGQPMKKLVAIPVLLIWASPSVRPSDSRWANGAAFAHARVDVRSCVAIADAHAFKSTAAREAQRLRNVRRCSSPAELRLRQRCSQ